MDEETLNSNLEIMNENLDWEYIFEIAKSHNVAPLMYPNLKRLNEIHEIPPHIMTQFRKNYHITWVRNTKMYNDLAILLKEFSSNGIEPILIKGAALAQVVYKNIALRTMSDADMLIRKEDAHKARDILLDQGYKEDVPLRRDYFLDLLSFFPTYLKGHTAIEIKWKLNYGESVSPDYNSLRNNASLIMINNETSVFVPSLNDLFILSYNHLLKHKNCGENQLIWECDLMELDNLQEPNNEIKPKYIKDTIYLESLLQSDKLSSTKDLYFVASISSQFKSVNGILNKLLYIYGCFFPKKEFIIHQFGLKKETNFVCIYYFLRNLTLIGKIIKSSLFKIKKKFLTVIPR